MPADITLTVRAEDLQRFVAAVLDRSGVPPADAALIAEAMVEADLRGIHSHGAHFLPPYSHGLRNGELNPRPRVRRVGGRGAVAVLDGDNGLGHVVAAKAIDLAVELAGEHGIGAVAARSSNHFGIAAFYAMRALRQGLIGMITTNGPAVLAPWGGASVTLCNNPVAWAIPADRHGQVVLDMACSVAAREKVRLAARLGEALPEGWGADATGTPTRSPQDVLDGGFLLPIGGPKGYGLALVHEILAGLLPGAVWSVDVSRRLLGSLDMHDRWGNGHFALALDPEAFAANGQFRRQVDRLVDTLKSAKRAPGVDEILVPGEIEDRKRTDALSAGIRMPASIVDELNALAGELRLNPVPVNVPPAAGAGQA